MGFCSNSYLNLLRATAINSCVSGKRPLGEHLLGGVDVHTPWSRYSTGEEPEVTVPLAYPALPLTWRHPKPPYSNPKSRHQHWPWKRDTIQAGRCCFRSEDDEPSSPSVCFCLPREGQGQRSRRVIPLCPVAGGATPRPCQAPRQRSGRPPPQTRRTPGGRCPCLGPATGSQRNLKYPQERAEGKDGRLVHSSVPYSGGGVPVGSSRPTDHQQVTDYRKTPVHLWLCPGLPASTLATGHSV